MSEFLRIPMTGGVNRLDDPRKIRDDEVVSAKNIVPVIKGIPRKRLGTSADTFDLTVRAAQADYVEIEPISLSHDPVPNVAWVAANYTDVVARGTNGLYVGGTAVSTRVPGKYAPCIVTYQSKVYVFCGFPHPVPGYVIQAADCTGATKTSVELTSFAFAGSGNTGVTPAVATVYRERMVFGNLGLGFEDYIVFADPYSPTIVGDNLLAGNSRAMRIGGKDSGRVVAIFPVSQKEAGAPIDSALMVLKENRAFMIIGEPNKTTDATDMITNLTVVEINYTCGCASPDTVVSTPYGKYWAGVDDVWYMGVGSLPVRVGSKIRPVLAYTPVSSTWRWNASYFNGFYRLAVYSAGQDDGTASRPAYLGEQWWLDLRDGPPQGHQDARWWGPQVYTIPATNYPKGTNGQWPARLGGKDVLVDYITTAGGSPVRFYYDSATAKDGTNWTRSVTPGATESSDRNASEGDIVAEILTKEYDFEIPTLKKKFLNLTVDYWVSTTEYLKLDTYLDGGRTTDTVSSLVDASDFMIDADSPDNAAGVAISAAFTSINLARTFQELTIYPSDRVTAKTLQFKIYDQSGYVIGASNDLVCIFTSGGVAIPVTLTRGYYATRTALLTHIAAQLSTARGGVATTPSFSGAGLATLTSPSGSYQIVFIGLDFTASQLRKCRSIMGMLGWNTSADTAMSVTQTATMAAYGSRVADWEFNSFEIEYDVFTRGAGQ